MPCVIGLARKTKARLAHVPLCWFAHEAVETCSREQKYITLMYSPELDPALGFLKRTRCHHAKHAQIAVGFDSDGTSRGVASARYPDELNRVLVRALAYPHLCASDEAWGGEM